MTAEDVVDGPRAGVVVEQSHAQEYIWLAGMLGDKMRTADHAEVAILAGRGFVDAKLVLAAQPSEGFARHRRGDSKGRSMRLAAGTAGTQADTQA